MVNITNFIKEKLTESLNEAQEMQHFRERVKDRIDGIYDIEMPQEFYKQGIDINKQKEYIINQVKNTLKNKIKEVVNTEYPIDPKGIAVVVGLGLIKIKSNNKTTFINVKSAYNDNGKNEHRTGTLFVINVYNDRLPTIVLWGLIKPHELVKYHVLNTKKNGYRIDEKAAYFDDRFNGTIMVDLDKLAI